MIEINLLDGLSYEALKNKTDDYNIFKFYIESTGQEFIVGKAIRSPLRKENNPSFVVFNNSNGYLNFKDFGSGDKGGAIDMVMLMFKLGFKEAINKIYNDMFVETDYKHCEPESVIKESYHTNKKNIIIEKQNFTFIDYKFWSSFGISLKTLNKYNVISAKNIWVNETLKYEYTNSNPVFVYNFNNNYKIYRPLSSKRFKWRVYGATENTVEGLRQLEFKNKFVIITKSLKDVMLLNELNYDAVSMSSEGLIPKESLIDFLKSRYEIVYLFLDNDKTGKKMSEIISKKYNLLNISIPDQYEEKDLSDYYKKYGKQSAVEILNSMINGSNLPNNNTEVFEKNKNI